MRLLLLLGVNPTPGGVTAERTPLFLALQNHDVRLADQLRRAAQGTAGGTTAQPGQTLAAARAARLRALFEALAQGADINARAEDGATALFRAVADRRAAVAALLFGSACWL